MTLSIWSLGGIIILVIPFLGFVYLALRKAFSISLAGSDEHERLTYRVYALSTLASIIYFVTVSFTLLRKWTWGHNYGVDMDVSTWVWRDSYEPYYEFDIDLENTLLWLGWSGDEFSQPVPDVVLVNNPINYVEFLDIGGWVSIPFGVDGLSVALVLLTAFIFPLTFIYCGRNVAHRESMAFYLLILEFLLVVSFWTRDLVLFFIMFELILWPMYRLIVVWGSHENKRKAAMSFVLYTVLGSLILLVIILTMLIAFGTTAIDNMVEISVGTEWWTSLLWVPAFVSFAVKVPTFPFHHWLTLAHVEAPTIGSVVLAALLLKLGSYGFVRYFLPIFRDPVNFEQFMPIATTLSVLSVIFAAMMAISQADLKRIVAYSSIAHMNFSLLGLISMTDRAIVGGTILFIAHGFVSASMFFSVGMLYDRYHQRDLLYYRGLAAVAPVFSLLFFLTNLANLGVPLSFNFLGEFLIFAETINIYNFAAPLLIVALIVQVGYTMKLVSILFGDTIQFVNAKRLMWSDLTLHEIVILIMLVIPAFYFGIRGESFVDFMVVVDPLLNHSLGHEAFMNLLPDLN